MSVVAFVTFDIQAAESPAGLEVPDPGAEFVSPISMVLSFEGRQGIVTAAAGDYLASEVENDSAVTGDYVDDALNTINTAVLAPLTTQYRGVFVGGTGSLMESSVIHTDASNVLYATNFSLGGAGTLGEPTIYSNNPTLIFRDSEAVGAISAASISVDATDTGVGTEDVDAVFSQMIAGSLTPFLTADADGAITFGTGRAVAATSAVIGSNVTLSALDTVTMDLKSAHATRACIRFTRADGTPLARHGAYDVDQPAVANNDASKILIFGLGNIGATPRTFTMPDANVSITSFAATVLDDATASAACTTLGAVEGRANLTTQYRLPYVNAAGTLTESSTITTNASGYLNLVDSISGDSASAYYAQPYFGRLNYAVEPNNAKSEVRFVSKGALAGAGETNFVVATTDAADTGNNLVLTANSTKTFVCNAVDYLTAGALHLGGQAWSEDGVIVVSGYVGGSTGQGKVNGSLLVNTAALAGSEKLSVGGSIYSTGAGKFDTNVLVTSNGGTDNVGVGANVLTALTTGIRNMAFGNNALANLTDNNYNVAIGHDALTSTVSGYNNVAIGGAALQNLGTSGYNVAIGYAAGYSMTTGGANVCVGRESGYSVTGGIWNVAVGEGGARGATGNGFVAVGTSAAYSAGAGEYYVAVGMGAGYSIASNKWVAVGVGAGQFLSDGSTAVTASPYSIYLGAESRASSAASASNEIVIGYQAIGKGSNTVAIGNSSITDNYFFGDVNAWAASPKFVLHDSDCTDADDNATIEATATDTGTGAEDVDVTFKQQIAGTLTAWLTADADGNITFGDGRNVALASDTAKLIVGAGGDATIGYDGTTAKIITDVVAASDLDVDCGTEKTLRLVEPVYVDLNFGAGQAQSPASSAPGVVTFLDNLGADTDIATVGFAVGEKLAYTLEYNHQCVTNGTLQFHIHFQVDDAPTGTDYVNWQIDYCIVHDGETCPPVSTITTTDIAIDTQYEQVRGTWSTLSGINLEIGDQIRLKLTRIAAVGDAYAGECKLVTFGAHVQVDTFGSRTVSAK